MAVARPHKTALSDEANGRQAVGEALNTVLDSGDGFSGGLSPAVEVVAQLRLADTGNPF